MAINLQDEYNNTGEMPEEAPEAAGQDLVIPAAAAAQLAQFVSQGDCQSVLTLVSEIMGAGAPAAAAPVM